MTLKEKYNEFDSWIKGQDKDKINFLIQQDNGYHGNFKSEDLAVLKDIYHWHQAINDLANAYKGGYDERWEDLRPYVLGDKIATIEDIKNHMLEYLSFYQKKIDERKKEWVQEYGSANAEDEEGFTFEEAWNEDERSSGYAGISEYKKILSFWKGFTSEMIQYLDDNDMNLDGHRNYWFSHSTVQPLLFSHTFYNNMEVHTPYYNIEEFKIFSKEEIDVLYDKFSDNKKKKDEETFDYMIDNILKNFKDNKSLSHKLQTLKELQFNK